MRTKNVILNQIPIDQIGGVGAKITNQLKQLHLETVFDILFHFPFRYQDRSIITPFHQLHNGDEACIEGEVVSVKINPYPRRMLRVVLHDTNQSKLTLCFMHFYEAQRKMMRIGSRWRCYGKVRVEKGVSMYHPECQRIDHRQQSPSQHLTPIYPSTKGISQYRWRQIIDKALILLDQYPLPSDIAFLPAEYDMPLSHAVKYIHFPPADTPLDALSARQTPAQKRVIFEELVAYYGGVLLLCHSDKPVQAPSLSENTDLQRQLKDQFGFTLTHSQCQTDAEIAADMARAKPMFRLLQGDVGSGKTVVAALAALRAATHQWQTVVMAPTEILAAQHYANMLAWFAPLGIELACLSGGLRAKEKKKHLAKIASGEAAIVVGTHALFQQQVAFARLGLIIIDEQHRFGVHQRLLLHRKSIQQTEWTAHQLVMTATPIPRTLAMFLYQGMNYSRITELPANRIAPQTVLVSQRRRKQVITRIRHTCAQGMQAYWICTAIDETEWINVNSVLQSAEALQDAAPELSIGIIHGRQKADEKLQQINAFKRGEIHILVATTVVEVGVDIPQANLMVIENPERLGLSQLHQLRGRIGRGGDPSYCILLYQPPLTEIARERLVTLRQYWDGFIIAEKDLELRGAGEILGLRQAGRSMFRIADIKRDILMLPQVEKCTQEMMQRYPDQLSRLVELWFSDWRADQSSIA